MFWDTTCMMECWKGRHFIVTNYKHQVLECYAMWCDSYISEFWRNMLPSYSGHNSPKGKVNIQVTRSVQISSFVSRITWLQTAWLKTFLWLGFLYHNQIDHGTIQSSLQRGQVPLLIKDQPAGKVTTANKGLILNGNNTTPTHEVHVITMLVS